MDSISPLRSAVSSSVHSKCFQQNWSHCISKYLFIHLPLPFRSKDPWWPFIQINECLICVPSITLPSGEPQCTKHTWSMTSAWGHGKLLIGSDVLIWHLKDAQQLAKEGQETPPKRENAWALRQQATPIFSCISNSITHGTTITSVIMRWWGRRCEWMEGWKRKN